MQSARSRIIPCPFHPFSSLRSHRLPFPGALVPHNSLAIYLSDAASELSARNRMSRRHGIAVIVLKPHLSISRPLRLPFGTIFPPQFSQLTTSLELA